MYGVAMCCMAFLLEVFCLHDFLVLTRRGLRNCWCDRLCLDCSSQMMKGVLFAGASSISQLPPKFAQNSLRFVSYYGNAIRFGGEFCGEACCRHARLPASSIHA